MQLFFEGICSALFSFPRNRSLFIDTVSRGARLFPSDEKKVAEFSRITEWPGSESVSRSVFNRRCPIAIAIPIPMPIPGMLFQTLSTPCTQRRCLERPPRRARYASRQLLQEARCGRNRHIAGQAPGCAGVTAGSAAGQNEPDATARTPYGDIRFPVSVIIAGRGCVGR